MTVKTVKTVSPRFYVFNLILIFGDLTHSCFFLALFLRGKGLIKTMPGSGLTPGVNQRVKAWYLWLEYETIGNLQHLAASSQKWTLSDTLRNQLRSCRVWIALKTLCVFCGHAESARFSKCYIWSCYIWTWKKTTQWCSYCRVWTKSLKDRVAVLSNSATLWCCCILHI